MGVIADSIVEYAKPLLEQTDNTPEQLNKAIWLSQICWSLALLHETERVEFIEQMRDDFKIPNDKEFEEFKESVVFPMIERHKKIFPRMHENKAKGASQDRCDETFKPNPHLPSSPAKAVKTGRNAPCPCNSGKKYKRCCGQ